MQTTESDRCREILFRDLNCVIWDSLSVALLETFTPRVDNLKRKLNRMNSRQQNEIIYLFIYYIWNLIFNIRTMNFVTGKTNDISSATRFSQSFGKRIMMEQSQPDRESNPGSSLGTWCS